MYLFILYLNVTGKIACSWPGKGSFKQVTVAAELMDCAHSLAVDSSSASQQATLNDQQYATKNIAKYAAYLKSLYKSRQLPIYQKWPPTPSKKYINLALIKRDETSLSQAYELTTARLQGNVDQILKSKQSISITQLFAPTESETNCILIEGAPGVGKTTLAWELCRNWDILPMLRKYSLVILLQLREKKIRQANRLSDLLYHRNSTLKEAVTSDIEDTDGEGVLFIFDGFDELPAEQREMGSVFVDIINGLYLPRATVLITSRPSVTAELLSRCKPQINKHIEILGFTEANIKEYAPSIFQNPVQLVEFMKYVSSNPLVYSMMYIPLNSAIVVEIYRQNRGKVKPLPKTMTQLYDSLSHALLRRHIVETGFVLETYCMPALFQDLPEQVFHQFREICKVAFGGICVQQLTWNNLPESFDHLGFMTKSSSLHVQEGPEISFSFLHLTVQEFLAAFHISCLSPIERKQLFEKYSGDPHFQVVWRFLGGLTKFSSLGWELFKEKNKEESPSWLHAEYCLKPLAVQCLYESQDSEICSSFCSCDEIVGFLPETVSPFDCVALSYCIANSKCTWIIDLINAGIGCDALDMFVSGLHSSQGSDHIPGQIKELKIGKNQINQQGIEILTKLPCSILQKLPILKLYNCGLDQAACDQLAYLIPSIGSLKELDLGVNPIGNGGAVKLMQSLSKLSSLQLLDIASSPIGSTDITALSSLIRPTSTLRVLKIGDDEMSTDCIQLMLRTVLEPSSLERLEIRDTNLTSCPDAILKRLGANRNLKALELLWCTVGHSVSESIARALHQNTMLKILKIKHPSLGIESDGAKAFAQMLKINQTLEELIVFSDDSLGNDEVLELQNCAMCIKKLQVYT